MFGDFKLAKNADQYKYSYSGYGIGFDCCSVFSFPNFGLGKNTIIFGVDIRSVHIDNKKKDILFNCNLSHCCLVYMFSLRFSGSEF